MYVPNVQELTKGYMNQSEKSLSLFEYLGESLKKISRGTEAATYYEHK